MTVRYSYMHGEKSSLVVIVVLLCLVYALVIIMVVRTRVSSGGSVEGCCGFPIWQGFVCTCMIQMYLPNPICFHNPLWGTNVTWKNSTNLHESLCIANCACRTSTGLYDGEKKNIEIQPGFEPGSSECRSDALTNWATGALALEQRIDGIYP